MDASQENSEKPSTPIPPLQDTIMEERYNFRHLTVTTSDHINYVTQRLKNTSPHVLLLNRYNFCTARDIALNQRKWLMVNILESTKSGLEQNRDIWKNKRVKDLVSNHFILWRVNKRSPYGKWYLRFYHSLEKPIECPYVAIVDPRTGEKLQVWHEIDSSTNLENVEEFLIEYATFWDRSEVDNSSEELILE